MNCIRRVRMPLRACLQAAWPYAAVIFLQLAHAINTIISKAALNGGMNIFVFITYRHAVASLVLVPLSFLFERNVRPRLTKSVILRVMLLALLEPVAEQGLFFTGLRLTTATFAAALTNIIPAVAFTFACVFRLERVKLSKIRGIAKLVGTITSFSGAMIMTLLRGPELVLPWSRTTSNKLHPTPPTSVTGSTSSTIHSKEQTLAGAALIFTACLCTSAFIILQAFTLREYPAEMSLASLVCVAGTVQSAAVAFVSLRGHFRGWTLAWDKTTIAIIYAGLVCSALAVYLQGVIVKRRGPVFVTAFCPLGLIIVAVLGSLFLSEVMYLDRVLGAIVIVLGLYAVMWGKLNDGISAHAAQIQTTDGVGED